METFTAKGSFTVKTTPAGEPNKIGETTLGEYLVQKVFSGDIQGNSQFEMHTAGSNNGAAAYIAMEVVTGTLQGKAESFVLMHTGTMSKTSSELTITIAPELATGDLKGLEGKFSINVVGKEHFYVMEYSLPG
ncbi:MAG: DUF3224 domain-containing protein [Bacteroidota bacterium]